MKKIDTRRPEMINDTNRQLTAVVGQELVSEADAAIRSPIERQSMNMDKLLDIVLKWVAELRNIDSEIPELEAMARRGDLMTGELERSRRTRSERLEWCRYELARLLQSCEVQEGSTVRTRLKRLNRYDSDIIREVFGDLRFTLSSIFTDAEDDGQD